MSAMAIRVRVLLIFVCAAVLVSLACASALTPLLVHYMDATSQTMSGAGLLVAAYPVGGLVGAIPAGILSSRLGPRAGVLGGLAILAAATLAFGWATMPAALDAARFGQGLGGALVWSAALSWLAGASDADRRGALIGTALAAATVGELVGPGVGVLADKVGTGPVFSGAAAVLVMLMIAATAMTRPARAPRQRPSAAFGAARDPAIRAGIGLLLLIGVVYGVAEVLVPVRVSDLGGTALLTGGIFVGCGIIDSALGPLAGRIYDRRGTGLPVLVSLVAGVALSLAVPAARTAALLAIALVVILPLFGSLFTPATALLSDGADRLAVDQAVLFSLGDLAWSAGQAGAAALAGTAAQATSISAPWLAIGAICLLALLAVRRIATWLAPAQAGPAAAAASAQEPAAVSLATGTTTAPDPLPQHQITIRRGMFMPLSGTQSVPRRLYPGDLGSAGIADYRFVSYIGPGSLGGVFQARRPARLPVDADYVAVKILGNRTTADMLAQAVIALRAYAAVRSARLVPVYDVGRHSGASYYSMQYLAEGSLAGSAGLVPLGLALRAISDAAAGAAALHQAGITHLGIKPRSILLDGAGGAKLSGPALASIFLPGSALTGPGSIATLEFTDPAVLAGAPASPAADVWSLAATMHRVVTGTSLLGADLPAGDSLQAIRTVLRAQPKPSPLLPGPLAELVAECLGAPATRPAARQVARRLDEIGTLAPA
jgi:predicted MFS family arabinose efflux permease